MLDKDEFARLIYKNKEKKEMEREKELEENQIRSKVYILDEIFTCTEFCHILGKRNGKDGAISIGGCRGN